LFIHASMVPRAQRVPQAMVPLQNPREMTRLARRN
jgi:hypothetical protein